MAPPIIRDMMGTFTSQGVAEGPDVGSQAYFNIDDPNYGLEGTVDGDGVAYSASKTWEVGSLSLGGLPKIEEDEVRSCEQSCADSAAARSKKCTVLRRRVAKALKEAGCPSKVTPYSKTTNKCGLKGDAKYAKPVKAVTTSNAQKALDGVDPRLSSISNAGIED